MNDNSLISIVIPLFNEEAVIEELYRRLKITMDRLDENYEIILINDGSKDGTLSTMKKIAQSDSTIKLVDFSRNFGHQIAITAGIDYASGDAVVLMDADLQDPPEVIPKLVAKWKEGYDVVYAKRKKRIGESFFKRMTASLFYRLLKNMTNVEVPVDTGDFRLMDRKIVDILKHMKEKNRFVRGLVTWIGFDQTRVDFERDERFAGETKYPLTKMIGFAFDGITAFSFKPLKLASCLGFLAASMGFVFIAYGVILKIFTNITITGWTSLFVSTLFLGGVQLLCIGIIGEYVGRIYDETKKRPLYIVRDLHGFDANKK
jgi:dolichol-phosphate mannosyltransferase